MEPSILSEHLRKLAGLIDRSESPSAKAILAELSGIVTSLEGRQAAKLEKFMDKDFEAAVEGLDNLIKKLSKTSQTLNPQDEGKAEIEESLTELHRVRSKVMETVDSLGSVDI